MANILGITITVGYDGKGLAKANKKIGNFLKTGLKAGGIAAAGALAGVGAAATLAAKEAIDFAEQSNSAMDRFRRQTGLSQESVDAFGKSAQNIFAQNWGDDIGDIADSMALVSNVMQSGAKETEVLTTKALAMRDAFDKDVGESIDTVKVLMDEMGLSADQSFDFMAEGIQRGLDRSGDFLDTIREYGNLFSSAGFSANEMFSIIESGAAGGVLGTDKVADAVKEFQVRAVDADKDLKQGFLQLGFDWEKVVEQVRSGNETWSDFFVKAIAGITQLEDPLEKAQVQTKIFGTMAEDLGATFADDVANGFRLFEDGSGRAVTNMDDMAGSMDNVLETNLNIGESMEALKRQLVVALEPAAQTLLPMFAQGVTKVGEFLTLARPIFTGFAGDLSNTLGPAMAVIGDSLTRIAKALGIVTEESSGTDTALVVLKGTLDLIVSSLELVALGAKAVADAFEIARGLANQVSMISDLAGQALGGAAGAGLVGRDSPLNFLGFQGGGVVPGSPGSPRLAMLHGQEEIANPNIGQALVVGGEQFAVREAARLAAAINAQRRRDLQLVVDTVAEAL